MVNLFLSQEAQQLGTVPGEGVLGLTFGLLRVWGLRIWDLGIVALNSTWWLMSSWVIEKSVVGSLSKLLGFSGVHMELHIQRK